MSASGTGSNFVQTSITQAAVNFTDTNKFEYRISSNSSAYQASVLKAGLWLKLTSLSKGEVYYRAGRGFVSNFGVTLDAQRTLIETSIFTTPQVFFESTAYGNKAASVTVGLVDGGTTESGTTGTSLASSDLVLGATKDVMRTAAFGITSGDRFIVDATRLKGSKPRITQSLIVVSF